MAAKYSFDNARKPNFFIVGAPRCGTTAMYEYLRQHPNIFMPNVKEPHFFGNDLIKTPKFVYYQQDLQWYLALFSGGCDEARVGEATPLYLKSRQAAREIKSFSPSARIIIMLSNPIDMMYSLHRHLLNLGYEDLQDFELALEMESDRKRGLRIPKGCGLVDTLFYRDVAKYNEHVEDYFKAFGRQNVHVIVFDDFIADTPKVYAETLGFLEVSSDFRPLFGPINANIRIRSTVLRYLWINRPRFLQSILMDSARPSALRSKIIGSLQRLYRRSEPRPPLESGLRKRLQSEFAGEVERLSELLGRDLTPWCAESA